MGSLGKWNKAKKTYQRSSTTLSVLKYGKSDSESNGFFGKIKLDKALNNY